MRAWPKPLAWRLTAKQSWRGFHPRIEIPHGSVGEQLASVTEQLQPPPVVYGEHPPLFPEVLRSASLASLLRAQAQLKWINTIPREVRHTIRVFPEQQWHLLRLVAACGPPAMDLIRATPALGLALACARRFRSISRPLRSARTLLGPGHTQAEIAAWLGFPGTKAIIHLLRKLDDKCLSESALIYVRRIAVDPRLQRRAAHLPRLTRTCVRLLSDPILERMVGQRLLHKAAEDPKLHICGSLLDIARMRHALDQADHWQRPLDTVDQVEDMHDALVDQVLALDLAGLPIPPPPVDGTATIQPILTPEALAEEGRRMGNCVASYLRELHNGSLAIYRVLAPERATLSLRMAHGKKSRWILDQLALARNEEPSVETRRIVEDWLHTSPQTVPPPPEVEETEWDGENLFE